MGLDNLIQYSIQVTHCLTTCQLEAPPLHSPPASLSKGHLAPIAETMQID